MNKSYSHHRILVALSRYFLTLRQDKMYIFGYFSQHRYLCKVLVTWVWIFVTVEIPKVFLSVWLERDRCECPKVFLQNWQWLQ